MSYCFNLACQKPHNPENAQFCQGCGSKLLLGDRYRAIQPLGIGGFGRTLQAVDEHKPSKPPCVIKQFFYGEGDAPNSPSRNIRNQQKAIELFRQEAIQLDQLGKHPQIPNLYAYFSQDDRQYLIQEFIDGKNLAQELEENGALTEVQVRHLLNDLLPVLQFVHDSQVIHRDIKPDNIIRSTTQGKYILVDFGAAKFTSGTAIQKTGTVIGSAAYTAPEQLLGKAVIASDIYSLGVTCIHLLTQIPPFDLFDSTEGKWIWRDYLRTPISNHLGQILDKMLQPAIKNRYQSASVILADLNPVPSSNKLNLVSPSVAINAPQLLNSAIVPSPTPKLRNPQVEIEQALQEQLEKYWVKVQTSLTKNQLTVVINRDETTPVNYPYLVKEIADKIKELSFSRVEEIKVFGRVNNKTVPEWKYFCKLKSAQPTMGDLMLLKLAQWTTRKFWLAQVKNRKFWLDVLTFSLISFVFSFRLVILHPLVATLAAVGFMVVKSIVKNDRNFQEDLLYKQAIAFTLILGLININFVIRDSFAILLACLVVALPLFYIKANPG